MRTHAQILADIAAKVVEQHRKTGYAEFRHDIDRPRGRHEEDRRIEHDPSWDYRLDERWQG